MPDRRHSERRTHTGVPEPLERRGDRRHEDRREGPRQPLPLTLRFGATRVDLPGSVGIGGASCSLERPPPGDELELGFTLPDGTRVTTHAHVVGRDVHGSMTTLHLAFDELPAREALALAKWLDDALTHGRIR